MIRKSLIPMLFVIVGVFFLGIGVQRMADAKAETEHSLQLAKRIKVVQAKESQNESTKKFKPVTGQTIGLLAIPRIHSELAIVEGTDPNELRKGVGHYKQSFFPGQMGQIVLSGHRDTVFRHLGELKVGDGLEVNMPYGKFTYTITTTKIVDANDTSIITLQHQHEELILTT
ncbi:MAG: sortase, partial [Bacillota bacterium]|nr:sortase [Bacillota bacterium]